MPPFIWLRQFSYATTLAADLERLLEPPLIRNEIRSIYVQSFPYHYQLNLVQTGSFPHSKVHMEDIMQMTTFFANIHDKDWSTQYPLSLPPAPSPPTSHSNFPFNTSLYCPNHTSMQI